MTLKVNLNNLSTRAKAHIENPKFCDDQLKLSYGFEFENGDKILTARHNVQGSSLELLLSEVFCLFAKKKTPLELFEISFREIESFLRDENHLPAFAESAEAAQVCFYHCQINVISAALGDRFGSILPDLGKKLHNWPKLTLVEKNQWAQSTLGLLGLELVYCDEETLTVTNLPRSLNRDQLESLLMALYKDEEKSLPMKVVAV